MRAIYTNGMVYEGNMTKDGKRNGFGVLYDGENALIGWFKDDANHGNHVITKGAGWDV